MMILFKDEANVSKREISKALFQKDQKFYLLVKTLNLLSVALTIQSQVFELIFFN